MPVPTPTPIDLPVQTLELDSLIVDPANARTHDEKNLGAIANSLRLYGQVEPLICQASTKKIIGGNGRYAAMRELGWKTCRVTMLDIDDMTATALGIALNRTGELAGWDTQVLSTLLSELKNQDVDLDDLGFNQGDLDALSRQLDAEAAQDGEDKDPDDDDVDPPDGETRCQVGDIWTLGTHRLICGDSKILQTFENLCNGKKVDAVITDPPYGVSYVGKTSDALTIQNDGSDGLGDLLSAALGNAMLQTNSGACWYVWAPPGPQFLEFANILKDLEVWRQTIVWVKNSLVLGHSDYHYRHESCFYGWSPGRHMSPPDRKQDTVWNIDRPSRSTDHPTMKPINLIDKCILNSTARGQIVLEPFCGSGTTLLACETNKRICYAIELDPRYCDVILRRWEDLAGSVAVRQPVS
jgi:DNA modification methylase